MQELSVDQVRSVVLERAAYQPHEGRAHVVLVRRAEELSISAGNALLKTLEEPGRNTYFILLVSRGARLLSTIRSRSTKVRFSALADDVLMEILTQKGVARETAEQVIPLCAGSAAIALALADPDASHERETFVKRAIEALDSKDSAASLALAEGLGRDRPTLRIQLEAFAAHFAHQARRAAKNQNSDAISFAARHNLVLHALRDLERNASPALLVESLMLRLRAETG